MIFNRGDGSQGGFVNYKSSSVQETRVRENLGFCKDEETGVKDDCGVRKDIQQRGLELGKTYELESMEKTRVREDLEFREDEETEITKDYGVRDDIQYSGRELRRICDL